MGKIAFVFSGQGAQKAGMGKSFYENSRAVRALFDGAEALREGPLRQCFEGTAEELNETQNTQPCLFLADLAAAAALRELGVVPEGAAGFSLGELPALAFAGAYSHLDGFRLACIRGEAMAAAAAANPASMLAVMKLENSRVEEICRGFQRVYPVNYNGPGQLVVAGAKEEMEAFSKAVREAGGRGMPVAVGGGSHSPFMDEAAAAFGRQAAAFDLHQPEIPVYSNFTAEPYTENVRSLMEQQINHSLRWQESIERMAADGFDTFIEVGVGNTLKKLVARILPESRGYSVSDWAEAEQVSKEVGAKC